MKRLIAGLMVVVVVNVMGYALVTPTLTNVLKYNGGFSDVRWNSTGADLYEVFRSTYSGGITESVFFTGSPAKIGNPEKVKNVTVISVSTGSVSMSWDEVSLTDGVTYYFRVKAHRCAGGNPDNSIIESSELSNELSVYVPDRPVSGYEIWYGKRYGSSYQAIEEVGAGVSNLTKTGLPRNSTINWNVSAVTSYDTTGYGSIAPLSPETSISTQTLGCILTEPYSVSLSINAEYQPSNPITPVNVTGTVSVEGYDGYGGSGYYQLAHSTDDVFVEEDYTSGVTASITNLVDNNWQVSGLDYAESATNYYSIRIIDYNPDVTMVSESDNYYQMSYTVDHYEISVPTSASAGESFSATVVAKNNENVPVTAYISDNAIITPVLADNESQLGSDSLTITASHTRSNGITTIHISYRKAEDIKIKVYDSGKTAISDRLTVNAGTLDNIDTTANPASIISGMSTYITTICKDIYGNKIKQLKVNLKVSKGKGRMEKDDDTTDLTGKVMVKFLHDEGKPEVNKVTVTVGNFIEDVLINVAVLIYSAQGGTIIASEDPNTKVVIPPGATAENIQLLIKMLADLTAEQTEKINNANEKADGKVKEDTVREFEVTNEDGSACEQFDELVTIEMPYVDDNNDNVVDGTTINVDDLKVCRLDESAETWGEVVDGTNEVDKENKVVKAQVKHFSTYSIGAPSLADLSSLRIYPNPVNFSKSVRNTLKFGNVPQNTKVEIYDVTGRLVRSLSGDNNIEWDGRNSSGSNVSMGLYIYMLTDGNGNQKTGKIGVQK